MTGRFPLLYARIVPRRDFKTPPPFREIAAYVASLMLASLAVFVVVEACAG